MPEFIAITRPTREGLLKGPTPDEAASLSRRRRYIGELVHEGTALLVGRARRQDAGAFDVLIFKADDWEAAERLAAIDPAVVDGVMSLELLPFRIAMLSETWEGTEKR